MPRALAFAPSHQQTSCSWVKLVWFWVTSMLICACELQCHCLELFQFNPSWVLLLILNGHKAGQQTVHPGTHLALDNLGRLSGLAWQSLITQVTQRQIKTRDKLNWIQVKNQKFRKHNRANSLWDYRNIWGLHFLISTYRNFSTHRKESISILPCVLVNWFVVKWEKVWPNSW